MGLVAMDMRKILYISRDVDYPCKTIVDKIKNKKKNNA